MIDPRDAAIIRRILAPWAAQIERVSVFGSRALGTARPNSDIDLVVFGALSGRDIDRLWTLFDESGISVTVDVLAYSDRLYAPLRGHIDAAARTLFRGDELRAAA